MSRHSFSPKDGPAYFERRASRQARQGRKPPHNFDGKDRMKWWLEEFMPLAQGRVSLCTACGKMGPHYAPPSLGESGFYICQSTGPINDETVADYEIVTGKKYPGLQGAP
jgi:hypothetical protein